MSTLIEKKNQTKQNQKIKKVSEAVKSTWWPAVLLRTPEAPSGHGHPRLGPRLPLLCFALQTKMDFNEVTACGRGLRVHLISAIWSPGGRKALFNSIHNTINPAVNLPMTWKERGKFIIAHLWAAEPPSRVPAGGTLGGGLSVSPKVILRSGVPRGAEFRGLLSDLAPSFTFRSLQVG